MFYSRDHFDQLGTKAKGRDNRKRKNERKLQWPSTILKTATKLERCLFNKREEAAPKHQKQLVSTILPVNRTQIYQAFAALFLLRIAYGQHSTDLSSPKWSTTPCPGEVPRLQPPDRVANNPLQAER